MIFEEKKKLTLTSVVSLPEATRNTSESGTSISVAEGNAVTLQVKIGDYLDGTHQFILEKCVGGTWSQVSSLQDLIPTITDDSRNGELLVAEWAVPAGVTDVRARHIATGSQGLNSWVALIKRQMVVFIF